MINMTGDRMVNEKNTNEADRKRTKRGEQRRQKMIKTATKLFREKGYEATSLIEIIRISGGSLTSAYQYFQNKEGLFWSVFESMIKEIRERYSHFQIEGDDYQAALKNFVIELYANMCDPEKLRFLIIIIQHDIFRERAVVMLYRELLEPIRNILAEIAKRYHLQYVLGVEETEMCLIRHARGTVLELLCFSENLKEKQRLGMEQTATLLLKLTEQKQAAVKRSHVHIKKTARKATKGTGGKK